MCPMVLVMGLFDRLSYKYSCEVCKDERLDRTYEQFKEEHEYRKRQ